MSEQSKKVNCGRCSHYKQVNGQGHCHKFSLIEFHLKYCGEYVDKIEELEAQLKESERAILFAIDLDPECDSAHFLMDYVMGELGNWNFDKEKSE